MPAARALECRTRGRGAAAGEALTCPQPCNGQNSFPPHLCVGQSTQEECSAFLGNRARK